MKKLLSIVAKWFRGPGPRPKCEAHDRPACLVQGVEVPAQAVLGPVFLSLGSGWTIRELTLVKVMEGATIVHRGRYLVGPRGHCWAWRRGFPVQVPSVN